MAEGKLMRMEEVPCEDLLLCFQAIQDGHHGIQPSTICSWELQDGASCRGSGVPCNTFCNTEDEFKDKAKAGIHFEFESLISPSEMIESSGSETISSNELVENRMDPTENAQQEFASQCFHSFPIQQRARDGQKRWARTLKKLKSVWNNVVPGHDLHERFEGQLKLCFSAKFKKQKEALLRYLQISAVKGLIKPLAFQEPTIQLHGQEKNFAGWTGFKVVPQEALSFKHGLFDMFVEGTSRPCPTNTIHNMFRRANLVPQSLGKWSGSARSESTAASKTLS
ncbi:hypothetical protein GUITHDRAFT_105837 [Guillardia theta CCMP2712]|uniref:Uncharacterized protein n=1 Tax=Guillardia theta (strain CCMP2712) TaxID=905079 RepID=L1JJA0_GUITC|nr:hypothetical protein GUITHDRAFT_105837 [Guillardia theta CCMP2712]EKX48229.1 hypothetical protein GUITHDRAFT_105837 [Guillardia theta CCMP2712]|eukprot:XP_005835209.1 hypothetical protein GUITHDRAFT_105837 [Guillardia theta CCMP2712]